jgi:diguanylate cyclase (GGDEF)-like protein
LNTLEKLEQIKKSYAEELPQKLAQIGTLFEDANKNGFNEESFNTLYRLVHNLVGSGATFGFIDVSNAARILADELQKYLHTDTYPSADAMKNINKMADDLIQIPISGKTENQKSVQKVETFIPKKKVKQTPEEKNILIYIVDDDKHILDELSMQLTNYAYKVKTFLNTQSFEQAMQDVVADIILMDMTFLEAHDMGMQSIIKMKASKYDFKVIFMSSNGDFVTRVNAVRAESDAFITKPVDSQDVVSKIDKLTSKNANEPIRALLLDDENSSNQYHASLLNSFGIETKCIDNPVKILDMMSEFKPDIIMTDLHMPTYDGHVVLKVIRQMDEYVSIPIIFLSVEKAEEIYSTLMDAGSEDFLQKPVDTKRFPQIVKTKALRYRKMREMIQLDGLTSLYNHKTIISLLEKEISNSKRYSYPLSFAMLDLDNFKKVNDNYGHQTGDSILQSLSRVLKTRIRNSDFIGRYGGEEFCIIFSHTDAKLAFNVLEGIRKIFSSITHKSEDKDFHVTVSCGVCQYTQGMDLAELINKADGALYQAKEHGRNRTVIV